MNCEKLSKRWLGINPKSMVTLKSKYIYSYDLMEDVADQYFGFFGDQLDLRGLTLNDCIVDGVELSYCDLSCSSFENVTFLNSKFDLAFFNLSVFRGCKFHNCYFIDANSSGLLIENCHFDNVNFNGAKLINSKFYNVDFKEADFMVADFTGAVFESVSIGEGVIFKSAKIPDLYRDLIESKVSDFRFLERVHWV